MPLTDIYRVLRDSSRRQPAGQDKLLHRLLDVFQRTWDLGFTAFGGPNVHFQIFYRRFVETGGSKVPWIDEQTVSGSFASLNTPELQYSEGLPEFIAFLCCHDIKSQNQPIRRFGSLLEYTNLPFSCDRHLGAGSFHMIVVNMMTKC